MSQFCFSAPGNSKIIYDLKKKIRFSKSHAATVKFRLTYDFYFWLLCLDYLKTETWCVVFLGNECHKFPLPQMSSVTIFVDKYRKYDVASYYEIGPIGCYH